MRTVAIIALLIAVSVCFIGHVAVGSATAAPASVNDSDEIIAIRILPDGNADVSVIRTVPVETQNESVAFNKTARLYESGGGAAFDNGADNSLSSFRRAADAVSNESGRPMRIIDVENDTKKWGETGIFYRNFTWTSFTDPPEGDEAVNLNESFTAGNRPWLQSLQADQTLVISLPKGYELVEGKNFDRVEGNSVVYEEPRTFQQFDIVYREQNYQESSGVESNSHSNTIVRVLALVALVVVVLISVLAYLRRQTLVDRITDGDTVLLGRNSTDTSLSTNEHGDSGTNTTTVLGPADDTDTGSTTDRINSELLSDEERVERLLQNNGGRMRQASIVTETGWSDAKVSQLLSGMDEDERIEKLRIGRENLISLPNYDHDHDPGMDAGSDPDHAGND